MIYPASRVSFDLPDFSRKIEGESTRRVLMILKGIQNGILMKLGNNFDSLAFCQNFDNFPRLKTRELIRILTKRT